MIILALKKVPSKFLEVLIAMDSLSACASLKRLPVTGKVKRSNFRDIYSARLIRVTNEEEGGTVQEQPCFFVSEEGVVLQSSALKGRCTAQA